MADANVLKNAQKVEPARNKFREADGPSGIVAKLAIAGVIAQALAAAKSVLFGDKATAADTADTSDAEGDSTAQPFDAMEIALDDTETMPDGGEGGGPVSPRALGSGTTFSRQFGSADVSIPLSGDHVSADSRPVRAGGNDNAPVVGFSGSASANVRPSSDPLPGRASGAAAAQPGQPLPTEKEAPDGSNFRSNRAPEVKSPLRLGTTFTGQAIVIAAAELLRHAKDADADPLSIGQVIAGPGATLREVDGNWILTPAADFNGHVEIAFSVTDGRSFSVGRSVVEVMDYAPSLITGSANAEAIVGTPYADAIHAMGGDDDVIGREGADVVVGSNGNDRVAGGDGDDVIYGSDGSDVLLGQGGDDVIIAGAGDDVLEGGDGNDAMFGDEGADLLLGQSGNDVLDGGTGTDRLIGGDGDDTFVAQTGDGDDSVQGDSGEDTFDLSATTAPASVDLIAGTSTSSDSGSDVLSGIENVTGSAGNDLIVGDAADNIISGGQGNDVIDAGEGDDWLIASAGDGDDEINGGAGIDTFDASRTSKGITVDLESGSASGAEIGNDVIAGIENVAGGSGNDAITANELVNVLCGGTGDDVFVFRSSASAGSGRGNRDVILDFEPGDRIDLRDISREFDRQYGDIMDDAGLQKFTIIASGEEFARPGQVRFAYEQFDGKTTTIVQGNTDYDASTEFEIEFAGRLELNDHQLYKNAGSMSVLP